MGRVTFSFRFVVSPSDLHEILWGVGLKVYEGKYACPQAEKLHNSEKWEQKRSKFPILKTNIPVPLFFFHQSVKKHKPGHKHM